MAAWVFSSPALRATLDPASLVADWALERALARLGEERFDLPPSFPTPSAWWGDADVLRPEVERWKDSFLKRGGSGVQRWLDEAAPYMPHVRSILLEEGLPPELWVLTLLESGFRPEARSPSAAVGPWQFLAATARHTGLLLSTDRDQRRDWEHATRAACRYLNELRAELGEGLLALAAFNCGPGRVKRAIKQSHDNSFWTLDLPAETERYVPRALALAELVGSGEQKPFRVDPGDALAYEEVEIPHSIPIRDLALVTGTTPDRLRELNPSWLRPVTPGDGHPVTARVPAGTGAAVRKALETGKLRTLTLSPDRVHRVASGETLWGISRRHGVGLRELREVNGLREDSVIRPGQVLRIPG
jgi:membrane-bound lytic murein transglycosylase D